MNPEAAKYLFDIVESIAAIDIHIKSISTIEEFIANITVSDAVERRLQIIGEAMWKAIKIDSSIDVSDRTKIINLRHVLVHDYNLIDKATLWYIVTNNLPLLRKEIENLIEK